MQCLPILLRLNEFPLTLDVLRVIPQALFWSVTSHFSSYLAVLVKHTHPPSPSRPGKLLDLKSCSATFFLHSQALELDNNNEKGLFRRGEAHLAVNDFDLARADFQKVLQLYPSNKAAKTQLAICQQRIRKQLAREKKLYANMFERLAEEENKVRIGWGMTGVNRKRGFLSCFSAQLV